MQSDNIIEKKLLSEGQKALWISHKCAPNIGIYNNRFAWKLPEGIDFQILKKAIKIVSANHEALTSTYQDIQGTPYQIIHSELPINFKIINLPSNSEVELLKALDTEIAIKFDLEKSSSVRWTIYNQPSGKSVLAVILQHINNDQWSFVTLINQLKFVYAHLLEGTNPLLPHPKSNFQTFIRNQHTLLDSLEGKSQLKFWVNQLSGAELNLNLPYDYVKGESPTFQLGYLCEFIPERLSTTFGNVARKLKVSLFSFYFGAFHLLLHKYTGQQDITVTTPTGGRDSEYSGIFNYFVNPILSRTTIKNTETIKEFFINFNELTSRRLSHSAIPLPVIIQELKNKETLKQSLFQTNFFFHNINRFENRESPLVTWTPEGKRFWAMGHLGKWEHIPQAQQLDDFDLTFKIYKLQNNFFIGVEYNTDLFKLGTIKRFITHFMSLMEIIITKPETLISQISLASDQERELILNGWNNTEVLYTKTDSLPYYVNKFANKTPNKSAITFESTTISYAELETSSNRLANFILNRNKLVNPIIGVHLDRTPQVVIAMLGIMKAGGVYLPLDPNYPKNRLEYIIEDAKPAIIISTKNHHKNLTTAKFSGDTVFLEQLDLAPSPSTPPQLSITADDTAYIIYTSGSTGKPKGTLITHGGFANLLKAKLEIYNLSPHDKILQFASINFDASISEFAAALSAGATLFLAKKTELIGEDLIETLRENEISWAILPPAVLVNLESPNLPHLKTLAVAGEQCSQDLAKKWSKGRRFFNAYGPTETTIWATIAEVDGSTPPPIGKPIANTKTYILDFHRNLLPIGIPGELYIGGDGLSSGYLNLPELTKEKFISNPFNNDPNSKLYKTGDLCRYLEDGNIEFLGRLDHQVKIRGFRVELGEIESVLREHTSVHDALIIARDDVSAPGVRDKLLVAYLVKNASEETTPHDLREFLRTRLPDYMVPAAFVLLDAFPLTPNEKIDREALPIPKLNNDRSKAHTPPRNEIERQIASVWQECLGVKEVSITENFFDIGGHSLLLAQVQSRLPENLRNKTSMVDLFKYPTIQSLAHFLEQDIEEEEFFLERDNHVERLRLRRRLMEQLGGSSIAIVGMAGRFPGAETVEHFWNNICKKSESITFFSPDALGNSGVPEEIFTKPNYVAAKAVLNSVSGFEAPFFNFTPREAQITDPQQRLFLECAWESLEDAGCVPSEFDGRIGVYGGIGMNQYLMTHLSTHPELLASVGDYPVMLGNDKDFLCTRVSYKLNLDGPAMVLQTACSTSLVAVHTACQALIHQECDVALAGGVSLGRLEEAGYLHQEGMIMSRDGHCRAFDAEASGTVQGQGCGIVVLKRLIDAMDNYDHIYAVISGSAINNDGSNKSGYTAPSVEGQAKAINMAQVAANVSPNQISYVEAHGTGTPIGDPIEIEALKQAFQQDTRPDAKKNATAPPQAGSCAIGSVKTNIGHLDAASGIAGLIKTAKALEAKKLPPTINYKTPNPKIDFASTPFYVNTELKEWDTDGQPRFAAVSSFGMGGTNAHAILTDAPNQTKQEPARPWHIVLLSARTPTALEAMTNRFVEHLKDHVEQSFSDVCYTLHVGRTVFPYRRYLVCRNRDEAIAELEPVNQRKVRTSRYINRSHKTVFMFSGQGSQYQNMGRYLYQVELAFRDEIDKCRSMLKQKFVHIFEELSDADYHGFSEKIHQTYITQPGLFMFEYAIAKMLMSWGIEPDYMVGHSIGEYVAACLAGVFTLEQALELVTIRGHLIQGLEGGDMLSVNLPESEAARFVNHDVSVAAVNGESRCVMSGASKAIQYLHETLDKQGIENRILHTSHAFHSHMMDPILERFKGYVQRRQPQAPKMPFVSSMTGEFITAEEATSPEYWTQHLRNTVQYHKAISTIFSTRQTPESASTNSKEQSATDEALIFLEIGPGKVLTTLTKQHPDKQPQDWILPTTRHAYEEISDTEHLMKIIARLWEQGVKINWNVFHQNRQRYRVPLPTYPFERQQHWIKPKTQHYQPEDLRILEDNVHTPQDSAETADISDKVSARDEVENVIWKTWCQALGRMDIGVFDDFFELGGDSLLAVNIIDKLHRQFHVPMATHILIQKPTIADLAEHIKNYSDSKIGISEDTEAEPNTGALVVIQKGDPGVSPLIMVHPIGGEVFFYRDLARYLGRSQPVYAFQAPSLSGNAPTIHSVEVMAKLYTSELHKANLEPPYYLGGSSFGGLVAYEMAQQLTKLDAEVKLVVMVDTPSPTEMPRTLNNSAAILEYLLEDKLTLSTEKLHELDAKSQISYVLEQARLQGKASVLPPHLGESLFTTWMAHQEATFNYEPQAYMGNVLFFRHTEPMKHFPALPHLAWQSLVTGDFKVHQIPGNHVTMNYQPHVKTLADHLRPFLNS